MSILSSEKPLPWSQISLALSMVTLGLILFALVLNSNYPSTERGLIYLEHYSNFVFLIKFGIVRRSGLGFQFT